MKSHTPHIRGLWEGMNDVPYSCWFHKQAKHIHIYVGREAMILIINIHYVAYLMLVLRLICKINIFRNSELWVNDIIYSIDTLHEMQRCELTYNR